MRTLKNHISAIACATAFLALTSTGWAKEQVPLSGHATGQFLAGTALPTAVSHGRATHLGEIKLQTLTQLPPLNVGQDEAGNTVITFAVEGELTAANGNKLFTAVVVEQTFFPDGTSSLTGVGVIEDGTGRFENATGELTINGEVSAANEIAIEFEGSISSVGSSKR